VTVGGRRGARPKMSACACAPVATSSSATWPATI
jgi:hypothetical protein